MPTDWLLASTRAKKPRLVLSAAPAPSVADYWPRLAEVKVAPLKRAVLLVM
jgi:hypothetical protein